jgi:hypothetical protein
MAPETLTEQAQSGCYKTINYLSSAEKIPEDVPKFFKLIEEEARRKYPGLNVDERLFAIFYAALPLIFELVLSKIAPSISNSRQLLPVRIPIYLCGWGGVTLWLVDWIESIKRWGFQRELRWCTGYKKQLENSNAP